MSDAIDQLRRAEVRALRAQDRQPLLRKIHWLLLKRPVNQTREQRARLRELVHSTPPRSGPWYLHELFDPFGHYRSLVWAEGWLDEWGSRIMRLADRTDEEVADAPRSPGATP